MRSSDVRLSHRSPVLEAAKYVEVVVVKDISALSE